MAELLGKGLEPEMVELLVELLVELFGKLLETGMADLLEMASGHKQHPAPRYGCQLSPRPPIRRGSCWSGSYRR